MKDNILDQCESLGLHAIKYELGDNKYSIKHETPGYGSFVVNCKDEIEAMACLHGYQLAMFRVSIKYLELVGRSDYVEGDDECI